MTDTLTILRIPSPLTPLIGRDRELDILLGLLRGPSRLVTLTGIGGIGKTRLGHQAILELEPEFTAAAAIAPLAEIRDASQVPVAIARIFGINDATTDTSQLADIIGPESRLLLLDNLEQIPEIQPVIVELLEHLPQLTILATSQIPLDLPGEQLFPLSPLAMNTASGSTVNSSAAVELFIQRAMSVNPHQRFDASDISTIGEICSMLEGIPLAIELAAGRTSIMSPAELKDRLANRLDVLAGGSHQVPHRQRTMRNAIAWSYDLLSSHDQRIFRYLGVFVGSMGLDAIEHTLRTLETTESALDTLDALVARGLLHRTFSQTSHARYHMLQTLREFALEQLHDEGEEFGASLSHANYVVNLAETAKQHLQGPDQPTWMRRLGSERASLLAATEWSASNRPDLTVRILSATWNYICHYDQIRPFLSLGIQAMASDLPENLRALGWMAIGMMESFLEDDYDRALEALRNSLEIASKVSDHSTEVRALTEIGTVWMQRGDLDEAEDWYEKSIERAREVSDIPALATALANLGFIAHHRGNNDGALETFLQVKPLLEQSRNARQSSHIYGAIGLIHTQLSNYELAHQHLIHALEIARSSGNVSQQITHLANLGNANLELRNYEAALTNFDESIELARKAGLTVRELECRSCKIGWFAEVNDTDGLAEFIIESLSVTRLQSAERPLCAILSVLSCTCFDLGMISQAALLAGAVTRTEARVSWIPKDYKERILTLSEQFENSGDTEAHDQFIYGASVSLDQLIDLGIGIATRISSSHPSRKAPKVKLPPVLTPRELEVLAMMAKGYTNAEIADEMFISLRTITTHCSNIFSKLEVKNRAAAIALALTEEMV